MICNCFKKIFMILTEYYVQAVEICWKCDEAIFGSSFLRYFTPCSYFKSVLSEERARFLLKWRKTVRQASIKQALMWKIISPDFSHWHKSRQIFAFNMLFLCDKELCVIFHISSRDFDQYFPKMRWSDFSGALRVSHLAFPGVGVCLGGGRRGSDRVLPANRIVKNQMTRFFIFTDFRCEMQVWAIFTVNVSGTNEFSGHFWLPERSELRKMTLFFEKIRSSDFLKTGICSPDERNFLPMIRIFAQKCCRQKASQSRSDDKIIINATKIQFLRSDFRNNQKSDDLIIVYFTRFRQKSVEKQRFPGCFCQKKGAFSGSVRFRQSSVRKCRKIRWSDFIVKTLTACMTGQISDMQFPEI